MTVDTNTKNFVTEINQLISSNAEQEKIASTEDVLAVSERLIKQNIEVYEVLAK